MTRLIVQGSEQTKKFYDDLVEGKVSRGLWGKEKRFSPHAIINKHSVLKHFTLIIRQYISNSDHVLDLGCGPGGFLSIISKYCQHVTGADIVPNFVQECSNFICEKKIYNASSILITPGILPFPDAHFDKIVMIDTIHHIENVDETMVEIKRILKKDGLLLVFEPNKLNPLLYIMCLIDKNERGLLNLGTFTKYIKLFGNGYEIQVKKYNGLLIGPDSKFSLNLAEIFSNSFLVPFFGWLSPKIFILARKK